MPLPRQAIAQQSAERGRACSVLGVDRSSVRYRSVRPDDADLRKAMKAVAIERRRFGYRRVHVMLERQGWPPLGRFALQIACRAMGEPEEVETALSRREAASPKTWRSQTFTGDAQANAGAWTTQ